MFRPGTTDQQIYDHVYVEDEYKISESTLDRDALVVDIGCHIGSFSKKAWDCGFDNIKSFEANSDTYEVAKTNLDPSIDLQNKAVWGIDQSLDFFNKKKIIQKSTKLVNHGANRVIPSDEPSMETVCFSEIAKDGIGFLKMDCEGAEYSIIYENEDLLKNIKNIAMECHDIPETVKFFGKEFDQPTTPPAMVSFLQKNGFKVQTKGSGRLVIVYASS